MTIFLRKKCAIIINSMFFYHTCQLVLDLLGQCCFLTKYPTSAASCGVSQEHSVSRTPSCTSESQHTVLSMFPRTSPLHPHTFYSRGVRMAFSGLLASVEKLRSACITWPRDIVSGLEPSSPSPSENQQKDGEVR